MSRSGLFRLLCFLAPGAPGFLSGNIRCGVLVAGVALVPALAAALLVVKAHIFMPTAVLLWAVLHGLVVFHLCDPRALPFKNARQRRRLGRALVWLCFAPAATAIIIVASHSMLVPVTSQTAFPALEPGDWVFCQRLDESQPLALGELVVVRCENNPTTAIMRVMGFPGDVVSVEPGRLCDQQACLPAPGVGNLVMESKARHDRQGTVEVLDGRFHTVVWPSEIPPGQGHFQPLSTGGLPAVGYVVLPDNREPDMLRACLHDPVVQRSAIVGYPLHVLFSEKMDRIGLKLN